MQDLTIYIVYKSEIPRALISCKSSNVLSGKSTHYSGIADIPAQTCNSTPRSSMSNDTVVLKRDAALLRWAFFVHPIFCDRDCIYGLRATICRLTRTIVFWWTVIRERSYRMMWMGSIYDPIWARFQNTRTFRHKWI